VDSPFVVAPTKILQYIDAVFGEPNVVAKYCQKISPDDKLAIQRMISAFNQQLPQMKIVYWQHALVDHSCRSYAVRIDLALHSAAFSMVFSGDTRPTRQVSNLCLPQVDLLIHEATYADIDLAMAKTKKHSTRSEALAIGNGIAKRTLLTHFSQRYNGVHIEAGRDERTGNLWLTAVDGLRKPGASLFLFPLVPSDDGLLLSDPNFYRYLFTDHWQLKQALRPATVHSTFGFSQTRDPRKHVNLEANNSCRHYCWLALCTYIQTIRYVKSATHSTISEVSKWR
jgi:hypothetical protein